MTSIPSSQHRFNTVAKTVHASFAKAAAGEAQHLSAFTAASSYECFEHGKQQQQQQGKKQ